MAGPAGMVVVSPKNSTSMPLPARSRSLSRPTRPPRRRVDITALPDEPSSGTMVRPMAARCSTKNSNSSGGSIRSATEVMGRPCVARNAPPYSQLPTCGSAMMTPFPAAIPSTRYLRPWTKVRCSTSIGDVRPSRAPSTQYRA